MKRLMLLILMIAGACASAMASSPPPLAGAFYSMYSGIYSLGGWSIPVLLLGCALLGAFVWWIRKIDEDFEMWWLHYLLYIVTAPVLALFILGVEPVCRGFVDCACYLLTTIMLAIVPIHAGWGIRQCGMEDKMYHRNFNRQMGEFLLLPLWILLISAFWRGLLSPMIYLCSSGFDTVHYGFWAWVLGTVVGLAIMLAVIWIFIFGVVPFALRIAGRWPVIFMTCTLWWALVRIGYNWLYAHFYGFGFVCAVVVCAFLALCVIGGTITEIKESFCPMCHYFEGRVTDLFDHGVSSSTSTGWESMSNSSISARHSGAEVSNAQRRVRTTVHTHSWTTEHTCARCGCVWTLFHSEEVGRNSTELERRWDERY